MGKQREWARQCVAELAKQCPEALDLARLLSPAIRVESALIRTMRLTMLPGSGAWIEAELWFSPLVKSRNVASLLFQPAVVDYLQAELTELWQQPDKQSELSTARMVMEEVHKNMSPALLLEEKVAWAAIAGNLDEINEEIAPAVKALLESTGRPGLVSWAGQAMHRLPNSAFKTDAGQVLRVIAQKAWPGAEESSTTSLPTVNCPAQLFETLPLVSMGVARRGPLILLGALSPSAPHVIPVPDTEPRLVDLRWEEKGLSKSHRLSVPVGGQAEWMVGPSSSVELHNVRGQVFQAPEFVPWAGGRSNWLELSVTANHNKEIFTLLWTRNGEKIQQEVAKYSPRVLEELLSASWPTDWQDFDGQGIFGDWLVKLFQIISLPRKLAERLPVQSDLHLILDQLSGRIPWEYWLFSLGMTGRMVRAQRKQSPLPIRQIIPTP
ncbi:MAG: hypothetical protein GY799_14495 [Desulfobulbaceae bacterium]|nr:hypothetical protein [Desulfobulbaceae bacterium]